jgi:hypothetical protein
MRPVTLAPIPGPARVVAAPVIADAERYDADAQRRAILENRHAPALIFVIKVVAVHPAAIALKVHVAPGKIVDAAADIDERVGRHRHHQGIVRTGAGAQTDTALGIGRIGRRDSTDADRREK